jgi:hypothetical protein
MVFQGALGESRLAVPFLVARLKRRERSDAIERITEAYFDELEELRPLLDLASSLSKDVPVPKLPEKPAALRWLELIERRGLINPGTWFDQPKGFSDDVYAAELGRSRHLSKRKKRDLPDFAGAPSPVPLVKR